MEIEKELCGVNAHGVKVRNMVYQIVHMNREMTEVCTCEISVTRHTILQMAVEK